MDKIGKTRKATKKELSIAMELRDNFELGLVLNVSYDIFILGDEIEKYLYLKPIITHFDDINNSYDSYYFQDKDVTIWLEDKTISTIRCTNYCFWLGQNLIGMKYDSFLDRYKILPEESEILYVYDDSINRGQNQIVYSFDKEGLLIWVWRNKIKTVLVSKYE